jgi:SAM-dependent methyltransferase
MCARSVDHLQTLAVLARERELMNSYAPYYHDSLHINSYFYRHERRVFLEWVLRTLRHDGKTPADLSFLNAGCATGHMLEWLAERGCRRLTGLDHAEHMIETARRQVPSARFLTGTIEQHDFGTERFDAVIAGFTLHHMHRQRPFFEMVDRVLKPGGWFFILEYNAAGWENRRWGRLVFHGSAWPLRRLIKWKNTRALAQVTPTHINLDFNPAHRLLTYEDIIGSMPSPSAYRLQRRRTRGLWLPGFNYALVEDSAVDRAVHRALDALDTLAKPFGAGNLQWIAGKRIA